MKNTNTILQNMTKQYILIHSLTQRFVLPCVSTMGTSYCCSRGKMTSPRENVEEIHKDTSKVIQMRIS